MSSALFPFDTAILPDDASDEKYNMTFRPTCGVMNDHQLKAVFFATFPTGIPGIPRENVFFATFRAADDREFRVETENPESNPRPVPTQTLQDGGAHG